jgi:hypothetical protein
MMWCCMLWESAGYATRIEGKMDAKLCVSILEEGLQQTLEYFGKDVNQVIFKWDHDPRNSSNMANTWFQGAHLATSVPWF